MSILCKSVFKHNQAIINTTTSINLNHAGRFTTKHSSTTAKRNSCSIYIHLKGFIQIHTSLPQSMHVYISLSPSVHIAIVSPWIKWILPFKRYVESIDKVAYTSHTRSSHNQPHLPISVYWRNRILSALLASSKIDYGEPFRVGISKYLLDRLQRFRVRVVFLVVSIFALECITVKRLVQFVTGSAFNILLLLLLLLLYIQQISSWL